MSTKLENVLRQIDEVNLCDPNRELNHGELIAKEYLYSIRMTEVLGWVEESPSELLQIAARGQHVKRWEIPRSEYPMDRPGYLKWRTQLKIMHGKLVGDIMAKNGYSGEEMKRVSDLLMKKNLKKDIEAQTLEDVICLVFLQYYIDDFANGKEESKLVDIVRKTWTKMSDKGHGLALNLSYSEPVKMVLEKALG